MSFLEKTIEFISPELALKRARSKFALRSFDGASKGRRTEDWKASGTSANAEIGTSGTTLRNRTREQDRNNSYAKKAVNVITTNTIGSGIMLSIPPEIKGRDLILAEWNNWADYTSCDFENRFNFYGVQRLVMRTVALSGECLVIRKFSKFKKGEIPLQLQVLETDYLDDTKDSTLTTSKGKIFRGVEFDKNGKRKGYWIYDSHPGDLSIKTDSTFISADKVTHVFLKDRPGQEFGVPFGVTAMITLKDLKDYQDAELYRQKIAASYAMFVKKQDLSGEEKASREDVPEKIEPGTIQYLNPGEEITYGTPPTTTGYNTHINTLLHNVAAGYGITYEALTGDMSMVNFSSGRMGWLEFHRQITDWQLNMIIPQLCDVVFGWWLEAASISGLKVDGIKPQWSSPRREMIDPVKEISGMVAAIRAGLMTRQEAVRQLGYDPGEIVKELVADMVEIDKHKLVLSVDVRNDIKEVAAPK